jgi:probable rRNA maturation factor
MNITISWRAEKMYPRPKLVRLKKMLQRISQLAGTGIRDDETLMLTFFSSAQMAEVNWDFLQHKGDTDVICFDYRESRSDIPEMPCDFEDPDDGEEEKVVTELLICPAVAAREAGKRGLPYSRELILYMVHGLLHASGYDDLKPELKRKMRNAERRVLTALEKEFVFSDVIADPLEESDRKEQN